VLRTNTPPGPNQTYLQNAFQVTELRRPTHLADGTLDLRGRVTQLFGFPDGDFTALFDSPDGLGGFSFLASADAVDLLGAATTQLDIGAHDGVDSVTFKRIDQASAPYKVIISTSTSSDTLGTWEEIGTGDWTQAFPCPPGRRHAQPLTHGAATGDFKRRAHHVSSPTAVKRVLHVSMHDHAEVYEACQPHYISGSTRGR
jgi:hypothetical protein